MIPGPLAHKRIRSFDLSILESKTLLKSNGKPFIIRKDFDVIYAISRSDVIRLE